jgi:peptidoglycan/LPS O-acetylase OafA/YrhL
MASASKNSLDLLRLSAATLVLYSHQHALLGLAEPHLFGWTTYGGVGVSIFFFLSGLLVWSSWARDPDSKRFFARRCLRIFPALWVVVALSVLVLGPLSSNLTLSDYLAAPETRGYLSTAVLLVRHVLPGVFSGNPYPGAVNGSLWTLPVEFLCYVSVALVGSIGLIQRSWLIGASLGLAVLAAAFGAQLLGARFVSHFEMVAFFWWGVLYGFVSARPVSEVRGWAIFLGLALLAFFWLGTRGTERTGVLFLAGALVIAAQHASFGSRLTEGLGDLSYGMYIFAFPVQQLLVALGQGRGWSFAGYLSLSCVLTGVLAYASWHLIEKKALLFKPQRQLPV